jgi:Glycosyltransferase family 87
VLPSAAVSIDLPRPRTLLLIVAMFVWFACGVEGWRRGQYWHRLAQDPSLLLTEPWNSFRAFVSREGDDHLYYEYAGLMLGRETDLTYIAGKQKSDPGAALTRLRQLIRPAGELRVPYRDFPVEYPPLPLALMLLPRLVSDTLPGYRVALAGCLGALFLIACWLGAALGRAAGSFPTAEPVWRRMGWLGLATGHLLVARFDLLPAVLVAGTLLALVQRRDRLAGVLAGLAFMTKLYPLLLLPPVLALLWGWGERRRALPLLGCAAAAALAVAAPFLIAAPGPFVRAVFLYGARPFQFESVPGSLILALQGPAVVIGSFGSDNVVTPGWLGQLAGLLLLAALGGLTVAALRQARADVAAAPTERARAMLRWVFAGLLVVLCLSKVLSPQFLIWLLPLAAVFGEREGQRVFRASFWLVALTHLFFPALYGPAREGHALELGVLLARNLGLLLLAGYAIRIAMGRVSSSYTTAAPEALPPSAR